MICTLVVLGVLILLLVEKAFDLMACSLYCWTLAVCSLNYWTLVVVWVLVLLVVEKAFYLMTCSLYCWTLVVVGVLLSLLVE
jgi:hypothetical protein